MISVEVEEAQKNLPGYLKRVAEGETVILCDHDKPVAEIRGVEGEVPATGGKRPIGLYKGQISIPDSFFDPLPDDMTGLGEDSKS